MTRLTQGYSVPVSRSGSLCGARGGAALLALALLVAPLCRADDDREARFIGPGVRLLRWTRHAAPHALYAVEVDPANPLIRVSVSTGGGDALALEPLSRQAARLTRPDRYPIAGVNGDFFLYPGAQGPGIPTSIVLRDGELVRTPFQRPAFIIDGSGRPSIRTVQSDGRVRLPGDVECVLADVNEPRGANRLVLYTPRYGASTRTPPNGTEAYLEPEQFPLRHGTAHRARVLAVQTGTGDAPIAPGRWVLSGAGAAAGPLKALQPGQTVEVRVDLDPAPAPEDQVIGGSHRLLRDGKIALEAAGGSLDGPFITARHPRTAVGYNGRRIYLLTVDGRQPGYSAGMSLTELAQALRDLGCTDGLNLDGGGSTTLWARGAVVNRPSDGRERAVANGLLVFSTAPQSEPVRLAPAPAAFDALAGAELPLAATAEDAHYNPSPVAADQAVWSFPPALGTVSGGRLLLRPDVTASPGQESVAGDLGVDWRGLRGTAPLRIYPRPARVEVFPAVLRLRAGTHARLQARAFSAKGRLLALPPTSAWLASPEIGAVDETGSLTAGAAPGRGVVEVTINGVAGTAQVEVTATP